MVHCPNCGREVTKPIRWLENHCFTIQAYDCGKCHHNFKVTVNHSKFLEGPIQVKSKQLY